MADEVDHSRSNGHVVRQRKHGRNSVLLAENNHDAGDITLQLHELEDEMDHFVDRMRAGLARIAKQQSAIEEHRRDLPSPDASESTTAPTEELRVKTGGENESDEKNASPSTSKRDAEKVAPPRKTFELRNSLLTDMMQISHLKTLYNMSCAVFILFFLTTFVYESVDHGGIKLDLSLLYWAFGKFPIALVTWCCIQICSVVFLFIPFHTWASHRKAGSKRVDLLDYAMCVYYVIYQLAALVLPLLVIVEHELPPATGLFLAAEQVRMMMKTHAYVREKAADIINSASGREELDFNRFLYFLFVPTLIYRDDYPRTQSISWQRVGIHLWHLGLCIFFLYYDFVRFGVPVFRDFDKDKLTVKGLVLSSFHAMFPGVLIMFITFFGLLHSWMNAFAEMLRFGDRQFYRDWWNSTSFAQFYRNWNVIVHDWLHQYVYRDIVLLCMWRSPDGRAGRFVRNCALVTVFVVSAVWHEYFVSIVMHCLYPIMFMQFFGAGMFLYFIALLLDKKQDRNVKLSEKQQHQQQSTFQGIMFWSLTFLGYGWLMCLFSTEWYARINCKTAYNEADGDAWKDFFVSRSIACAYPQWYKQPA